MVIFIIIIFTICLLSLILLGLTKDDRDGFMILLGIFSITMLLFIVGFLILLMTESNDIPAIEVYKGNTTLQITYQDSIPIDSVVVYKNK